MKIHRFIFNFDTTEKNIKITDKEIVSQIRNVLKLKVGEQIILSDGKSNEALCSLAGPGKDSVIVKVEKFYKNENEPWANVVLYCAVLKKENFELVVQKATEIGVKEIMPVISSRTVKLNLNKVRLEKIIKEAGEQSGRGVLPILHEPAQFKMAVKKAELNDINLFFDMSADDTFLQACKNVSSANKFIGVWIGPEGGWDQLEINLAQESGFKIVNLGKLTLRGETAAVIASYFAIYFKLI